MKIKDQTIKELDGLRPDELLKVYDLITSLKASIQVQRGKRSLSEYIKVREALKRCKGSLSADILLDREDRL